MNISIWAKIYKMFVDFSFLDYVSTLHVVRTVLYFLVLDRFTNLFIVCNNNVTSCVTYKGSIYVYIYIQVYILRFIYEIIVTLSVNLCIKNCT